jgi:hypothetical protein
VAQHHDEGHQRTTRPADLEMAEMAPLCREPDYAEYRRVGRVNRTI